MDIERRAYSRFNLNLPINLQFEDPLTNKSVYTFGQTIDISESGAGICTDSHINGCVSARVNIDLSPYPPLRSDVQVKWVNKEKNQCGLQFLDPKSDFIKTVLREINIQQIETFLGCHLPKHIKTDCVDSHIFKKLKQEDILNIINFEPPFLKIKKIIIFVSNRENIIGSKSIGFGIITRDDTEGHYNETIFLALCGQLMGQAASIHLAAFYPESSPQVIEVDRIKPLISTTDYIWKPHHNESRFFVETIVLKKKLSLVIVNPRISFGDVIMGVIEEGKLILAPKDSIWTAKELPFWK